MTESMFGQNRALQRQLAQGIDLMSAGLGAGQWQLGASTVHANEMLAQSNQRAEVEKSTSPIAQELRKARRLFREHADGVRSAYKRIKNLRDAVKGNITPVMILEETNQEVSRVMLEKYGFDNYMRDAGAVVEAADEYGELLSIRMPAAPGMMRFTSGMIRMGSSELELRQNRANPNIMKAVRVKNSTPEPDGSIKEYILRVPPWTETPKEGLAWTFGFENAEDYSPDVMT